MRLCIPELIESQSEQGGVDLDLSVKLKDLTENSYFAIHYAFLKQHVLPSYSENAEHSLSSGNFSA